MRNQDKRYETKLRRAKELIYNKMENPVMSSKLLEFGYNRDKWQKGIDLYKKAERAFETKDKLAKESKEITTTLNNVKNQIRKLFSCDRTLAKKEFEPDSPYYTKLGLDKVMSKSSRSLLSEAKRFYKTILSNSVVADRLSGVGIVMKYAKSTNDLITNTFALEEKALKVRASRANATKAKEDALKELEKWCSMLGIVSDLVVNRKKEKAMDMVDVNFIQSIIDKRR